jgi:Tetratricopeptide repeat/Cytochrome c554 and c-prime/Doubled CXXCH motif (Paired_CXXCH_1)
VLYSTGLLRPFALLLTISLCASGADFAGSQACAACHAAIYRSFMGTPMAQGSGRLGTGETKETFNQAQFRDSQGAFAYRVGHDGGAYFFEFNQQGARQPNIQGRRSFEYFVGSGAHARSYLLTADEFLYEAPVAYYTDSASWQAAPGFASTDYPLLTRPILPGCLECHTTGVQRIPGTQNGYASPPFREGGVGCERCHGPGSDHIASGKAMLNPAKLAPRERDSICEQCHLSGEIRVPKVGKDDLSFRPGDRLDQVLTVFVRSGSESDLRVTSHAENLAASACKRASGDKLWCGSCHDPHSAPSTAEKAAYYRAKCLNCHANSDCRAAPASRRANADDCTACHMPRNPPSDVEHVVFTDHSIRRRPASSSGGTAPRVDADLVPFRGGEAGTRDLGLGYAMVGLRENNAVYLDRAFQLLKATAAQGGADALAAAYLAQFYRERKDDAHALPLYEAVWQRDQGQSAVAAALGAYRMQYGKLDEAIRFWNQALAISPALLLVRVNLAEALLRAGRPEEAQAVLRKALEFNPTFQPARDLLNRITK